MKAWNRKLFKKKERKGCTFETTIVKSRLPFKDRLLPLRCVSVSPMNPESWSRHCRDTSQHQPPPDFRILRIPPQHQFGLKSAAGWGTNALPMEYLFYRLAKKNKKALKHCRTGRRLRFFFFFSENAAALAAVSRGGAFRYNLHKAPTAMQTLHPPPRAPDVERQGVLAKKKKRKKRWRIERRSACCDTGWDN